LKNIIATDKKYLQTYNQIMSTWYS